jgi:hypothetical protein
MNYEAGDHFEVEFKHLPRIQEKKETEIYRDDLQAALLLSLLKMFPCCSLISIRCALSQSRMHKGAECCHSCYIASCRVSFARIISLFKLLFRAF